MAPYAQHVLVSTGKTDWLSKIEDEKENAPWGRFAANFRNAIGPRGRFFDPYNNVLISTSSFAQHESSSGQSSTEDEATRNAKLGNLLLFPHFLHLRDIDLESAAALQELVEGYLLPEHLHSSYSALPEAEKKTKTRSPNFPRRLLGKAENISNPTILICSHMSRDSRCGILGPLLRDEFARQLERLGVPVNTGSFLANENGTGTAHQKTINIGCISHIGGHKWAGNIIIYLPRAWAKPAEGYAGSVSGKGIWYGRVEPKHVEGILNETVYGGKIIQELFRGGVDDKGNMLRL